MIDGKSVRQKLIGSNDERAVSPVIGVILMVAITVILAAVIAAFVLDMGSGVEQNAQAGANIDMDTTNDKVAITYNSKQNADYIKVETNVQGAGSHTVGLCNPGSKVTYPDGSTATSSGTADDTGSPYCDGSGSFSGTSLNINGNSVSVIVTAVKGDTETVIAEDEGSF